jgi:hypothetical protein
MDKPQQSEMSRAGHSPVDQDSRHDQPDLAAGLEDEGRRGKIPPEKRRARQPRADQDKPRSVGGAGHGRGKRKR